MAVVAAEYSKRMFLNTL